jgi:glycosyltransferase involved in cell wall biosynthesis
MLSQNRQPIALISDHADPAAAIGAEEAGGQNVYVRQVGEKLAALGWQVDMFTRKTNADDPAIVQHSPYCRTIRLKAGPEQFIPRDRLFEYMPEFVQSFQAWQSKQAISYPLIHTNYWLSAWVGLELRKHSQIQLVHTYHSLGAVKYKAIDSRPAIAQTRLRVEKQILEQVNCVVATSPQEQESLRQLVSQRGRIEIVPCGTDTDHFHLMSKAEARAKLGLDLQAKIVLYVGRFDPRKGIETLVRSCAQLKSTYGQRLKLIVVGGSSPERSDGAERARKKLCRKSVWLNKPYLLGKLDTIACPSTTVRLMSARSLATMNLLAWSRSRQWLVELLWSPLMSADSGSPYCLKKRVCSCLPRIQMPLPQRFKKSWVTNCGRENSEDKRQPMSIDVLAGRVSAFS